jgi:hypothetical protein
LREYLRGQLVLDGAVAEVRSIHAEEAGLHSFENRDYLISRPIHRSPGYQPIRWHLSGESGVRPWGAVAIVPPHSPVTIEVGPAKLPSSAAISRPNSSRSRSNWICRRAS